METRGAQTSIYRSCFFGGWKISVSKKIIVDIEDCGNIQHEKNHVNQLKSLFLWKM